MKNVEIDGRVYPVEDGIDLLQISQNQVTRAGQIIKFKLYDVSTGRAIYKGKRTHKVTKRDILDMPWLRKDAE